MNKDIKVQTNDLKQPVLILTVEGVVKSIVEINPKQVRLYGVSGTSLFTDVEIIPQNGVALGINGLNAASGHFIKYDLRQKCSDGHDRYIIRIENTRTEKGRYKDTLFIQTDNRLKPVIPIRITGIIE